MNKVIKIMFTVSLSMILAFANGGVYLAGEEMPRDVMVESGDYAFEISEIDKGDEGIARVVPMIMREM